MNNATFLAADRTTHLKVVAISLLASICGIVIALTAEVAPIPQVGGETPSLAAKADRPYLASRNHTGIIR